MLLNLELTDAQIHQIALAVKADMRDTHPSSANVKFTTLSELIRTTGKSREWFVGRADPWHPREGILNHYRKELEGTLVNYPSTPRGRYGINLSRMIDWVAEHGMEDY